MHLHNRGNPAALILDPIVDGFHLTRVLMDGGSSLNLLYQDTVRKMGIDHSARWLYQDTRYLTRVLMDGGFTRIPGMMPLKVALVGLVAE